MRFYDDIINGSNQEADGKIEIMSPKEYLMRIFDIHGQQRGNFEKITKATEQHKVDKIIKGMQNGIKYDLPVLDYRDAFQEGRHRALAAIQLGVKQIPVLVVKNKSKNTKSI